MYEIGAIAQGKPAKHSIFLEPQNPAIHEFGGFEIVKCSAGLVFFRDCSRYFREPVDLAELDFFYFTINLKGLINTVLKTIKLSKAERIFWPI